MVTDLTQKFKSHPDKLLYDHLNGVSKKALKRWDSKLVEIVSKFHDLGKINPNFQNKLKGNKTGYDNHSYPSAFAWLVFTYHNKNLFEEWFGKKGEIIFSIAAIIAKHHGNLPDLENGFFSEEPRIRLKEYLLTNPELPISDFLQHLIPHKSFSLLLSENQLNIIIDDYQLTFTNVKKQIFNPIQFFHDTQFGFSCLIEADKRDAGNNDEYERFTLGNELREIYTGKLEEELSQYKNDTDLNCLRTEIRHEAIANLKSKFENGERVFTLTSPTGSGKTMMLLTLANEIIKRNPEHDILYALPFLSITEQVEAIAKDIFGKDLILRVDSKSENKEIQNLLEKSDSEPEKLQELLRRVFSEETFDHPFIITTFVRFFETLVSNRNSELLKLPNFAKRIFLIDELQALPPRLYIFFAALLDEFCRRFDSYAIISTATMPYLEIEERTDNGKSARNLFRNYPKFGDAKNRELLNAESHFSNEIFDRYTISRIENDAFTIDDLADEILSHEKSCLIILNTIQDTKDLYEKFQDQPDTYILLNTHFHLEDRKAKIKYCQDKLKSAERVVLISTQLIEAGVDIDFPVLYRDICPMPSLIQSAGRCNRNGNPEKGKVFFFELRDKNNNKLRANYIYREQEVGQKFLEFCRTEIISDISEKELFHVQKRFFEKIGKELLIGLHNQNSDREINMVDCIQNARFETLGKFKLIDEKNFGEEYRYYVPKDDNDNAFDKLIELQSQIQGRKPYAEAKKLKIDLDFQLRSMSDRVVALRLRKNQVAPNAYNEPVFGLRYLTNYQDDYSCDTGIRIEGNQVAIL